MTTGLLTLAGVVIGSWIAGGFDRGFSKAEVELLFPRVGLMPPPTTTELNAS